MIQIKPRNGNIVLKTSEKANKTPSGLYLPDSATKKEPIRGRVAAACESLGGKYLSGSILVVNRFVGAEIEIEGVTYLIVNQRDVMVELVGKSDV